MIGEDKLNALELFGENEYLHKEIERLNNIIEEQDKELELERKSRQLLTDDLANVCEMSLKKDNIIKEVREEVRIYEEQSNDGATNELDNYVFVQRLKKVLDKENSNEIKN